MKRAFRRVKAALMPGLNLIASFLQQATAQGTRSTILNPLGWFFALCTGGLLGSVRWNASLWIQLIFGVFAILGGTTYLGAYVFCLLTKQPELLRTEKYLIQQLAIEKGFRGDSITGPITSAAISSVTVEPVQNQIEGGAE
jgi:hypothetical protein